MRLNSLAIAPALLLAAGMAAGTVSPVAAHDYALGSLSIMHPWSRATPPGASTGAGYLVIANAGPEIDRLTGASSPVAARVEIHNTSMDEGIMRMRHLPDGVAVPAGGQVALAPGGVHLMLLNLNEPLKAGTRVPVVLRFARAGEIAVDLAIEASGARGPAASHTDHP